MKFGLRTPSPMRSLRAKTTGRAKRAVRKAVNPLYGKKGMGWVNNPEKAAYHAVYSRTTFSTKELTDTLGGDSMSKSQKDRTSLQSAPGGEASRPFYRKTWCIVLLLLIFPPAGIFLLWKYSSWGKLLRIALSALSLLILLEALGVTSLAERSGEPAPSALPEAAVSKAIGENFRQEFPPVSEVDAPAVPSAGDEPQETPSPDGKPDAPSSQDEEAAEHPGTASKEEASEEPAKKVYVLNTSSKKIHRTGCSAVQRIDKGNYAETDDLESALAAGYEPCGICNPTR